MKARVVMGVLAAAVACAVALVMMRTTPPEISPIAAQTPAPAVERATPESQPAIAIKQQTAVPAPTPAETLIEPANPPSPATTKLTAETLAGSRWQDDAIDVVFMADGRWQMNGRICAKWAVEGDRVKIFDDNGEVHYVDIVGDSIAFNGKKIGRATG